MLDIWGCLYSHSSLLVSLCHISDGNLSQAILELEKAILMGCPTLNNFLKELTAVVSSEVLSHDSSTSKSSGQSFLQASQSWEDGSGQARLVVII